jgi:hypothetical protein
METLALVSANRAAHVLAPRILNAAGRPDDARRLADLPRLTTVAEAHAAMQILVSFVDEDAAFRAAWASVSGEDWGDEMGGNTQWRRPRHARPDPSTPRKADLSALALQTLARSLDLVPAPCGPSTGELELDCVTPSRETALANAIVATVEALELATRAGLDRGEAEQLAIDTFTELVVTARASKP